MKTLKILLILLVTMGYPCFAGELTKQTSFQHSVTENGNIQVRMVTEYLNDGKFIDKKYGQPMTPADTSNMVGWDQKSKDIVTAITDKDVKIAFETEHKTATGIGLETIVTWDRVIKPYGVIAIRCITRIYDDGEVVSKKIHLSWIMPGRDASKADVMSKAIAEKIHTQAVIDAYEAYKAKMAIVNEEDKS